MDAQERERGKVHHINSDRGFGFLQLDSGEELFFHSNDIEDCQDIRLLERGDPIECLTGKSERNPDKREAHKVWVLADLSRRKMAERRPSPRRRSRSPRRSSRDDYRPPPRDVYYARESDPYGYERDRYAHAPDPYARGLPPGYPYASRSGYGDYATPPRRYEERGYEPRGRSPPPRGYDPVYDPYERERGYAPPAPRGYSPRREHRDHRGYSPRRERRRRRSRSPRGKRAEPGMRDRGTVVTIHDKGYGFIKSKDFNTDVFFPAKSVVDGKKLEDLSVGDEVDFVYGVDRARDKIEAQKVRLVYKRGGDFEVGARIKGKISRLKNNFGFITTDQGGDVYFHGRHLQSQWTFEELNVGDTLEFDVVKSQSKEGTYEGQKVELMTNSENAAEVDTQELVG